MNIRPDVSIFQTGASLYRAVNGDPIIMQNPLSLCKINPLYTDGFVIPYILIQYKYGVVHFVF